MNKILQKLKSVKHIEIIVAVVAIAVMLFIYFYSPSKNGSEKSGRNNDYCYDVTLKLQDAVQMLTGGECKVVVSWESSAESLIARNVTKNGSSETSQAVLDSGGAAVIKEVYPKAVGVVVVCKKLNSKTKAEVTIAVSRLMDIQSDRVVVLGSNK